MLSREDEPVRSRIGRELIQRFRCEGDVFFAGGFALVVGLDPVFPVLAGGAVFAGELEAGDLGVADFALFGGLGREELEEESASVGPETRLKI